MEDLAIGNFKEALDPPSVIGALLGVAQEKDIYETNLLYHKVPITDMQPIPEDQLKEAIEWIRDTINEKKIMVFCNQGIGRSSSVVIGYLCCVLDHSFGQAVEYVATKRPYMSLLPSLIKTIGAVKRQIESTNP